MVGAAAWRELLNDRQARALGGCVLCTPYPTPPLEVCDCARASRLFMHRQVQARPTECMCVAVLSRASPQSHLDLVAIFKRQQVLLGFKPTGKAGQLA